MGRLYEAEPLSTLNSPAESPAIMADVWLGSYSLVTFFVTAITGIIASKYAGTEIMGLTERLVVTVNVQYIFVLALNVFITSA